MKKISSIWGSISQSKGLKMTLYSVRLIFYLSLLTGVIISACLGQYTPEANLISLDPSHKIQTISGWEAVAQAGELDCSGFDMYKDELFDLAINDLGINRVRLEIYSGTENPVDYFTQYLNGKISRDEDKAHWYEIINDNADPNVINSNGFHFSRMDYQIDRVILPLRELAAKRGEKLFINVTYVDFGGSTFEHKDYPEEYGEFVIATYKHLKDKYGIVPDSWEVILEPDTGASWSGTQIGQAVVAAGNRLKTQGTTPYFVAPSTTNMSNAGNYFDQAIAVNGASDYIKELSYHRYAGVSEASLQAIADRGKQYNIATGMLEHIGSGYQDLHQDLKVGNNSAWEQFTLAFCNGDDGGSYYWIDNNDPNKPVVNLGSRTRYLRQYFKFIRNGAVRIGSTSNSGDFEPLAFINKNGGYVVVVKANKAGSFDVTGLPGGGYGIKYTTGSSYNIDLKDVVLSAGQALHTEMPASGVLTIYSKPNAGQTVYSYIPIIHR